MRFEPCVICPTNLVTASRPIGKMNANPTETSELLQGVLLHFRLGHESLDVTLALAFKPPTGQRGQSYGAR
jgi:hypothetical protein